MGHALSAGFADLYEAFLSSEKPRVTAQGYASLAGRARRMLAWFEDEELPLEVVSLQDAIRYQAYLSERRDEEGARYAAGTMQNYLKVARRFFDYLVKTGLAVANPFRELHYPRAPERLSRNALSEAQMGRLLRTLERFDELPTARARERRYRVHVIAETLYATGLRVAEAASLVESDLDLERRLVHLREGKGGKPRTAFLTSFAAAVLARYLSGPREALLHGYARKAGGRLFGAGTARIDRLMNGELAIVCARLGLPVITCHGFRHSLGTQLLRAGCDMRHIQAILGHESIGTTQVYTHVDKDDLLRSLDEHHPRQWDAALP